MNAVSFPEPRTWQLVVRSVRDVTPRMRAIELDGDELEQFTYLPGQDVALSFRASDGTRVRRRYTIRSFDRRQGLLQINVVMHGNGPGMRWAASAEPGTEIEGVAPRGKITIAEDADWHLFAGDATAVPGAFAMIEALRGDVAALGFFLVDDPDEQLPFEAEGRVRSLSWRFSNESKSQGTLLEAIDQAVLPGGPGHAYLGGEVGLVSTLKAGLIDRGWPPERISGKAYWNRGRANAGHGEPEQKVP